MSSSLTQIKVSYEVNEMTVEEIAQDQDMEIIAVKAALMNSSPKYRKDCGVESLEENDHNFSNNELDCINKIIVETALCAETPDGSIDWRTRLDAAKYIRDDKKGRKEVVKQLANNTFNLFQFNEQMAKIREMKQKLIEV